MEAGGSQLSLNIGTVLSNKNARTVDSAHLVLQGGRQAIDSLLDPDREYDMLVRVLPDMPAPTAVRDAATSKVKAAKLVQNVQVKGVRRADTADAISGLFAAFNDRDPKAANELLAELCEMTGLRAVA